MDKETSQEKPSPSPNNIKEESQRKLPLGGGSNIGTNNDRLKRDEWSEGAVSTLLEAYETKWVLRNRAKLKGHDWEDVARHVSSRANSTKSPKTQTQCKNKIESMKKRYRSESASTDSSSWPLYQRLDLLLRGSNTIVPTTTTTVLLPPMPSQQVQVQPQTHTINMVSSNTPSLVLLDQSPLAQQPSPPPPLPQPPIVAPLLGDPTLVVGTAQNSQGSNGADRNAKEDCIDTRLSNHVSDKNDMDTDSSTPDIYTDKDKCKSQKQKMRIMEKKKKKKKKRKRREEENWEIADSIRWLAEVVLRSEQSRMDTMREIEKMRIAAEAKRCEMDLKRTEILANTQLEIAKLFAGVGKGGGVDSSLRIGRN